MLDIKKCYISAIYPEKELGEKELCGARAEWRTESRLSQHAIANSVLFHVLMCLYGRIHTQLCPLCGVFM